MKPIIKELSALILGALALGVIVGLLALLAGCTTVTIPTQFGDATATAPVFLSSQTFELERTSDTLTVKYTRGTDPQATGLSTSIISAAVSAAAKGAK
jgi:hypothetical protein